MTVFMKECGVFSHESGLEAAGVWLVDLLAWSEPLSCIGVGRRVAPVVE